MFGGDTVQKASPLDRTRDALGECVALTMMVGSGLRIFNAYPAFARKGEHVLLLSVRAQGDSGMADVRRMARRRAPLALRDDVGARGQRARLSRRSSICTANGATSCRDAATFAIRWQMIKFYLFVAQGSPASGKAQRDAEERRISCFRFSALLAGAHRARDLEAGAARRRSPRSSADTCGRGTGIS